MTKTTFTLLALFFVLVGRPFSAQGDDTPSAGVGLAIYAELDGSVTVRGVMPGGPGDIAGVKAGDVLVEVEGRFDSAQTAASRLKGATGSTVKIVVLREGKPIRLTLTRAMLGQAGQPAQPAPVPPAPAPMPVAPPMNAGPVPANGLPAFLRVGSRLTWQGGNSTIGGSRLVPDERGWIEVDGHRYSLEANHQSGGVGYTQLNIIHADARLIVADVKLFHIVDVQQGTCEFSGRAVVRGNGDGLGDYWVNPTKLAQMPEGRHGPDAVSRSVYALNNQQYQSISIRSQGGVSYTSKTYDLQTGLLLFGGTFDGTPGMLLQNRDNGQMQQLDPNKQFSHNAFVSTRQTNIPWAGAPAGNVLARGKHFEFSGGRSMIAPGLPALPPQQMRLAFDVSEALGDCFLLKTVVRADLGNGLPPNDVAGEQVSGASMLGGLFIPPPGLSKLQPNQVLDEDPVTRRRTIAGGTQGNIASIVEQGPIDLMEQFYDLQTGLMVGSRFTSEPPGNVGKTQTEYRLAGQN